MAYAHFVFLDPIVPAQHLIFELSPLVLPKSPSLLSPPLSLQLCLQDLRAGRSLSLPMS